MRTGFAGVLAACVMGLTLAGSANADPTQADLEKLAAGIAETSPWVVTVHFGARRPTLLGLSASSTGLEWEL